MNKSDILIIGSGLAGLFSACIASQQKKTVQVLSYGGGTLKVGGGTLEVLGYDEMGKPIKNPMKAIEELSNKKHPYAKVGSDLAKEVLHKFLEITNEMNYPYWGDVEKNQWIPTALGNFKPSCLMPKTMDSRALLSAKHILIVEFYGMKDFYAHLVAKNLKQRLCGRAIEELSVKLNLAIACNLRDTSALDIARYLETETGLEEFISQLKSHIKEHTVVILPPVLGTKPNYAILERLQSELSCSFIEVASLPPAVTGIRLEKLLINYAKAHGVKFVQKAHVIGAKIVEGKCISVVTKGFDRQREFFADKFILATGGVYGGGLIASMGALKEPIFDIDIAVPENQLAWSKEKLFTNQMQPFSEFGLNTDEDLNLLDSFGKKVADNIKVVGKSLANYDFCSEKSGNGVALITAYKATMLSL